MEAPKESEVSEATRCLQENIENIMMGVGAVSVSLNVDEDDRRDLDASVRRIRRAVARSTRPNVGIFSLWTVLSELCEPIAASLRENLSPADHARLLSKLAEISPGATPPGSIH